MVSSNVPLSSCALAQFVLPKARREQQVPDQFCTAQLSKVVIFVISLCFVLLCSKVLWANLACIVGFHLCLSLQAAVLTTPDGPDHLRPSPTFRT